MPKLRRASTKDLKTGTFRPHGSMELHVSDQMNVIEARGPFNRELVIAGDTAQERVDSALQNEKRWGTVLVFKESALAPPDALDEISRILKKRIARGIRPVGVAFVFGNDVEGARLMQPLYLKAYASAGILGKAFDNLKDAQDWLRSVIADQGSANHALAD